MLCFAESAPAPPNSDKAGSEAPPMDLAPDTTEDKNETRSVPTGASGIDEASLFEHPVIIERPVSQGIPFVFSSPHSGRCYPEDFVRGSNLDPVTLRRSEDCFVEELFGGVVPLGEAVVTALGAVEGSDERLAPPRLVTFRADCLKDRGPKPGDPIYVDPEPGE